MAATVSIFIDKGAGPSEVDLSGSGRFRTDDDPDAADTNNPVPVPTSGNNYSYWVHLFLKATGGTFTQINNIFVYTGGGNLYGDSGVEVWVGDETPTKNSGSTAGYDQATGTEGESGDELVANHSNITARTDASTFTSASPKSVSISESGSVINASGETSDYVVMQVDVDNTATPGPKTAETITFRFDES